MRHLPYALALASMLVSTAALAQAPRSLEMRALTSPEIKAAIAAGYTRVLVPSGGIEQNGPHMVLDKHDHIVRFAALKIAGAVGDMLVAPVLSIVPEGEFSPPTGNLRFAGTIGISEPAYEAVLDGVARSLKGAGFKDILFIGDHGQSQSAQARIAAKLSRAWWSEGVRVHQIDAYYDDAAQMRFLAMKGETSATIGNHAGLIDTSELLAIAPEGVRLETLTSLPRPLDALGASGAPEQANAELGKALIDLRIKAAIARITSLLGKRE